LSRPLRRLVAVAAAIALFAALIGASSASAATVVNGSFETGTLEGWTVYSSNPEVTWEVEEEVEPQLPPFEGKYFAVSVQDGPGTTILYQDIALEPSSSHRLQMAFEYESGSPIVIPVPDTLANDGMMINQQVRIDVVKPDAPITSLEPRDILATLFVSSEAENLEGAESEPSIEPRLLTADLSQFAGQTVRLRVSVTVTDAPLAAFVDSISVTSSPLQTPPVPTPTTTTPPAPPAPPSNVFTKGKVTLNKKTGAATLAVSVPGTGTLMAADVHSKVALASFARSKGKPKAKPVYVKSTTVDSTGAGTVNVPIRPTAAAKKVLNEKGTLAVRVNLTFAPTGGTAAAQGYSTKLVKILPAKLAPR
jgi:hypothetical protein